MTKVNNSYFCEIEERRCVKKRANEKYSNIGRHNSALSLWKRKNIWASFQRKSVKVTWFGGGWHEHLYISVSESRLNCSNPGCFQFATWLKYCFRKRRQMLKTTRPKAKLLYCDLTLYFVCSSLTFHKSTFKKLENSWIELESSVYNICIWRALLLNEWALQFN